MPQGRWSLSIDIIRGQFTLARGTSSPVTRQVCNEDKRAEKKKGMVAHPRVLTQRTPVLRSGDILPLLRALLSAAFFRSGFLLAAFLCSCHNCASPFVKFYLI